MKYYRLLIFFLIIALLGAFSAIYPTLTGQATKPAEYEKETAVLLRVVDGDTIKVLIEGETSEQSVRLLGINTPEKKMPHSSEAADFLRQFENRTIILERDSTNKDKYGRTLRYVYYEKRLLNKEVLENGLANSYMLADLKYKDKLLAAEKNARELEKGIWQKSAASCSKCIVLKELNYTSEFFVIRNECSFSCNLDSWFVKDAGRNTFYLFNMTSGEEQKIGSNNKEVWNNDGDRFFMFDEKGLLVVFYEYG